MIIYSSNRSTINYFLLLLMHYTILLYLLLSFLSLSAQEQVTLYKGKKARITPIVETHDSKGFEPFKIAERVELLFYTSNRLLWRPNAEKNPNGLVTNGQLNIPADSVAGRVQLDSAQCSDWQYTLYQSQLCEELMVAGCYEPRHLLVFYGHDDKPFGFIEICVSCAGAWVSEGLRTFVVCPERMAVLGSMVNQIAEKNNISSTATRTKSAEQKRKFR
ncbi:hypothetical protein K2F45_11480 [Sphingobacterium siyangense]|uniref:hypothetical protein n=1 Tax=Sphingobacterium siyangense TaxID=459529 RepID=UPI0019190120|nr:MULTISPECIES: hypothetical protein [Sphingobacterium]QQT32854.1 hypothetical protein I6I99_09940 [Sphingobacterium multivorum]UQA77557.1 hypothetical protein K2F45_11480 [Sphingobacterium siyangense]